MAEYKLALIKKLLYFNTLKCYCNYYLPSQTKWYLVNLVKKKSKKKKKKKKDCLIK